MIGPKWSVVGNDNFILYFTLFFPKQHPKSKVGMSPGNSPSQVKCKMENEMFSFSSLSGAIGVNRKKQHSRKPLCLSCWRFTLKVGQWGKVFVNTSEKAWWRGCWEDSQVSGTKTLCTWNLCVIWMWFSLSLLPWILYFRSNNNILP